MAPEGAEAPRAWAHVFSINNAHLHLLPRFSGIVRCAMRARGSSFQTSFTIVEDGSEGSVTLPYAVAFDMHAELERMARKRRIRCAQPTAASAAMLLCFELGRLHESLREGDHIVVMCMDPAVEAELAAHARVTVVNPDALWEADEFWRTQERALLAAELPPPDPEDLLPAPMALPLALPLEGQGAAAQDGALLSAEDVRELSQVAQDALEERAPLLDISEPAPPACTGEATAACSPACSPVAVLVETLVPGPHVEGQTDEGGVTAAGLAPPPSGEHLLPLEGVADGHATDDLVDISADSGLLLHPVPSQEENKGTDS